MKRTDPGNLLRLKLAEAIADGRLITLDASLPAPIRWLPAARWLLELDP